MTHALLTDELMRLLYAVSLHGGRRVTAAAILVLGAAVLLRIAWRRRRGPSAAADSLPAGADGSRRQIVARRWAGAGTEVASRIGMGSLASGFRRLWRRSLLRRLLSTPPVARAMRAVEKRRGGDRRPAPDPGGRDGRRARLA